MKAVIQRVKTASVNIKGGATQSIKNGLVVYVGIANTDTLHDIDLLIPTILNTKVFEGNGNHFEYSLMEKEVEVLLISQFTLFGSIDKKHQLRFPNSARPNDAKKTYKKMVKLMQQHLKDKLKIGEFGAYMNVLSDNDGPVTLVVDTKHLI